MQYLNNSTSFAYYDVGGMRFNDKVQALLHSNATGIFPKFCCNDEIYSCYNWAVEPIETLEALYLKRALEIRSSYDYLVLHFSGGADSANILETFINNNIPLEEILLRMPLKTVDKNINNTSAGNSAAEVIFTGYPLACMVKEKYYPNLKITVKDSSDYVVDYFTNLKNVGDSRIISSMSSISPSSIQNADIDNLHPDLRAIAESGKKIGHIFGTDKPPIYWDGTQYACKFLDKTATLFFNNHRKTSIDLPQYKEAFYWSPSTAPLIIKQAHAVKQYIKSKGFGPEILTKLNGRPRHNLLAGAIYNRTLPLPFSPEKSVALGTMQLDNWFFKNPEAEHVKNWNRVIQSLDDIIPAEWKHDGTMYKDMVGIYSRSYQIGA